VRRLQGPGAEWSASEWPHAGTGASSGVVWLLVRPSEGLLVRSSERLVAGF